VRTGNSFANADCDSDRNSHTDSDAYCHSNRYAYTDSYAYCYSSGYTNTITSRKPHLQLCNVD
jgi:hypothetical protein